jgi:hypothetical protein
MPSETSHTPEARRDEPAWARPGRATLALALLAAFALGCVLAWRWSGPNPMLWIDTSNDLAVVNLCLDEGVCPGRGAASSVPGFHQSAAWLEALSALTWLGLDPIDIHRLLFLGFAAAFPLTFGVALRLGGPWAAGLAMLILPFLLLPAARQDVLYNSRPLPMFGAILLVLAVEAVRRRSRRILAGAVVMAAILSNQYMSHLPVIAGLAWLVPVFARDRRGQAMLLAGIGALFVAALWLDAPRMWHLNLGTLLSVDRGGATVIDYRAGLAFLAEPAWWLMVASIVGPPLAKRHAPNGHPAPRGLLVPAVLVLPPLVLFTFAMALGHVRMNLEYVMAVMPAAAAGLATAATLPARRFLGPRVPVAAWGRLGGIAMALMLVASGLLFGRMNVWSDQDTRGSPRVSYADAVALGTALSDHLGFRLDDAFWSLRGPVRLELLSALEALALVPPPDGDPPNRQRLTVLKVPSGKVRDVPFPDWRVLRRSAGQALLLIQDDAWLDWSRMTYCIEGNAGPDIQPGCRETEVAHDDPVADEPFFPPTPLPMETLDPGVDFTVTLKVPIRFPDTPATRLFLAPEMPHQCRPRFVKAPTDAEISPDGHQVLIRSPYSGPDPFLKLALRIGSPGCNPIEYVGDIPFLLAGPPDEVRFAESLLRLPEK